MRKQPGVASNPMGTVTVLSVSPLEDDRVSLQAIIRHSTWRLFIADRVASALTFLRQHDIAVVLCERDLWPGTWIDLLENIRHLPHPPSLIVASGLADDRLWAEALNLGAWDVLAKPFDRIEVIRSLKSGWQHWHDQTHMRTTPVKAIGAAS
jgi:DNA-binding NtrC family response regulator